MFDGISIRYRNPLPHPGIKWERVADRPGEGAEYMIEVILAKTQRRGEMS